MARVSCLGMHAFTESLTSVIRIEEVWLSTEPMDMRAGLDTLLTKVVLVFGAAQPHHAYLFANARANRMKVFVQDGYGMWLCTRRLSVETHDEYGATQGASSRSAMATNRSHKCDQKCLNYE